MAEQMRVIAAVAAMPNVTLQVLPAVAHPANPSELIVTDSAAYVEHLAGGLVYTEDETIASLSRVFTKILSESEKAWRAGAIWSPHRRSSARGTRRAVRVARRRAGGPRRR